MVLVITRPDARGAPSWQRLRFNGRERTNARRVLLLQRAVAARVVDEDLGLLGGVATEQPGALPHDRLLERHHLAFRSPGPRKGCLCGGELIGGVHTDLDFVSTEWQRIERVR